MNFVASQVTEAARAFVGVQALAAMRLTLTEAKTIARATLGINRLQADALSIDYLVALMQSLAAQNANLRTATTP